MEGPHSWPILAESSEADFTLASMTELSAQLVSRNRTTPPATTEKQKTVFYLAYGSNLAFSVFQGKRQCRPLSARNVLVPTLRMTFDLPGLPYKEPCFANSARRDPSHPLPPGSPRHHYRKDRWHKGMVGVVYELTQDDYAHIIATEGGGASYKDVMVECYEIPPGTRTVKDTPTGTPFKAHTLFAPAQAPNHPGKGGRSMRPDPSYAQPSQRYLDLITTGAHEHALPEEYIAYLENIHSFQITTSRQRMGQALFLGLWMPLLMFFFLIMGKFAGSDGKIPKWLVVVHDLLFGAIWKSYDGFFCKAFGDGERTIGDTGDDAASSDCYRDLETREVDSVDGMYSRDKSVCMV